MLKENSQKKTKQNKTILFPPNKETRYQREVNTRRNSQENDLLLSLRSRETRLPLSGKGVGSVDMQLPYMDTISTKGSIKILLYSNKELFGERPALESSLNK